MRILFEFYPLNNILEEIDLRKAEYQSRYATVPPSPEATTVVTTAPTRVQPARSSRAHPVFLLSRDSLPTIVELALRCSILLVRCCASNQEGGRNPCTSWKTYSDELSHYCELEGVMIRLHPLYTIPRGSPTPRFESLEAIHQNDAPQTAQGKVVSCNYPPKSGLVN